MLEESTEDTDAPASPLPTHSVPVEQKTPSTLAQLQGVSDYASSNDIEAGVIMTDYAAAELLDLEAFSRWLVCTCVVTFDIELGQSMEYIYPPTALSIEEKANICYLSFPDSNSGNMGDTVFCFRVRGIPAGISARRASGNEVESAGLNVGEQSYLYGYAFFRQVKDEGLKRGYFQKSVVLLATQPYVGLYNKLVRLIAPEYFSHGRPLLEVACQNICRWPAPRLGATIELPVLGHVLEVHIPSISGKLDTSNDGAPTARHVAGPGIVRITASLNDVNIFECFEGMLLDIQHMWELVLTAEPVVVMSPYVNLVSEAVLSLVSLISPVRYCCDFRPYFTIHDSEFKEYTTKTHSPPSAILGVTNPFFVKTLQHWPNFVRVGIECVFDHSSRRKSGWQQGLQASGKPFLDKTTFKQFLKTLNLKDDTQKVTDENNAALRKYFVELTNVFMGPLERHFTSMLPLQKTISPWKRPPRVKPFDEQSFLDSVQRNGPQTVTGQKGDWHGLYTRFLKSDNFKGWIRAKQSEASSRMRLLYLEKLCAANIAEWIQGKHEVEIVDLLLRLREELTSASSRKVLTEEMNMQLESHIDIITRALPEDLRNSLQIS